MVIKTANPINEAFIIKAINKKLSENHRLVSDKIKVQRMAMKNPAPKKW